MDCQPALAQSSFASFDTWAGDRQTVSNVSHCRAAASKLLSNSSATSVMDRGGDPTHAYSARWYGIALVNVTSPRATRLYAPRRMPRREKARDVLPDDSSGDEADGEDVE